MQQRIGLARAFATEAPILLMDEPFSALDPLIRDRLQDELLELQGQLKRTIIFVSHDLDEAFKIGNRIAIMEGGRIVQCGTPKQIYSAPANKYVVDFVANMNPLNVLTVADVMETGVADGKQISINAKIKEVIYLLSGDNAQCAVVNNGEVIGHATRSGILRRLNNP